MTLSNVTYEQAKGKKYRREQWGWRDGPRNLGGYAYISRNGKVHFVSEITQDYGYGFSHRDDWYEVDDRGYRIPDKQIVIGGE